MYSIAAILFNSLFIFSLAFTYAEIEFFRAFMISNTGLFTFSILLLFAMMKRRSATAAAVMTISWVIVHLLFRGSGSQLYHDLLIELPLFVYAMVLLVVLYFNVKSLKKLFNAQTMKGVS